MTVAKYVQPNFLTQDHTTYKGSIDAACAVFARHSGWFAPHAQDTPVMTVRIDAGYIWDGVTLTEVAAQSTGTITPPVGNPRIDRVVVDAATGAVSVITGTPAGSPTAPALTAGKIPVAKISLLTSSTTITNSMITDERALTTTPPAAFSIAALTQDTNPDGTADYLPTYDASATGNKKVLLNDLLKIVGGLTADTSPDVTADYLLSYDASASGPKKVLHSDFFKGVNGLTTDTSGDPAADFLLLYKTSASAPRKILPNNLGIASATKLNAQSGAYTLLAADRGKLVSFTGSSSVTWAFTAAATLGDGWWCYLANNGTSMAAVTLDPNSAEQIDGLTTFKMYPGEVRIVQCTGSAFNSRVLRGFYLNLTAAMSPFTFVTPPGYTQFGHRIGAGGGSGARGAVSNVGTGGGGGACNEGALPVSLFAASETITIGTGGAAISGATTVGADGNNSSIGSLALAYGGGGGRLSGTDSVGGGGGGLKEKGNAIAVGRGGGMNYGLPGTSSSVPGFDGGFGGGGGGFFGTPATLGCKGGDSGDGGGGGSGGYNGNGSLAVYGGGNSIKGGGGGNGAATTTAIPACAPGQSMYGGDGGQGGFDTTPGTAGGDGTDGYGGGGGGGGEVANSGKGGDGSVAIWGI